MIKLGLLGKNIKHSRSQEIYEEILKEKIDYRLLDYENSETIPALEELFDDLLGLSITSPYKQQFNSDPSLTRLFDQYPAINCIKKINSKSFVGINTDYIAVKEILTNYINKFEKINVLILGDGVMASITSLALKELDVTYLTFSRKEKLADLNTLDYAFLEKKSSQSIIINCCSRDFIFCAKIPKNVIFWDHNYNLKPHQDYLSEICNYQDGLELLRLQALHALKFWNIVD